MIRSTRKTRLCPLDVSSLVRSMDCEDLGSFDNDQPVHVMEKLAVAFKRRNEKVLVGCKRLNNFHGRCILILEFIE